MATAPRRARDSLGPPPALGLRRNWQQFSLLVLISAFVGAMVGLERSVLPVLAASEFGLASASAALSFIAMFGLTKAATNLAAGWLADHHGRKRVLVCGWLLALPVPLVILAAPSWGWIVAANALLGVNQGLTWSTTVIMKIDLVGPERRGLAMGLNEFAGYLAVALAAFASAAMGSSFGLRAGAAWPGLAVAVLGLLLSAVFVRETAGHARLEGGAGPPAGPHGLAAVGALVRRSLWSDARLFSVSQAGLVNNLNDGMAWGLFPLFFTGEGIALSDTGLLVATYPAVWGICQVLTGALSDRVGRERLIVGGMVLQGVSLMSIAAFRGVGPWTAALVCLGVGTALVYPTLLAAVSDIAAPSMRGVTVGVYRMWRDLGYVVGALLSGLLADAFGMGVAIGAVGGLTVASGVGVAMRFGEPRERDHHRARRVSPEPRTGEE